MVDALKEFEESGAFLKGHFVLASGLHSDSYVQSALALQDPQRAQRLCGALAQKIEDTVGRDAFDYVVSPALGGIIVGHEVARALGCLFLFLERVDGLFTLRRGFSLKPNARCLIVEDVITTGTSTRECIAVVHTQGGSVKAVATLTDRSGGQVNFGMPFASLLALLLNTYPAHDLPPHLRDIEAVRPGAYYLRNTAPKKESAT